MRPQKNDALFYKERKRTQENTRSFIKNAKESKRKQENAHSFEKNICPTLMLIK